MGLLWKVAKVAVVLAIAVPLAIVVLTTALGIFGAVAALAFIVLRIAIVCAILWGAIRLVMAMFGDDSRREKRAEVKSLAPVDPHYEAAMRELDRELGHASRRS